MLLAIDCGNTNTVFAVFEGDSCRAQWRASTNAERTADEYAIWLTQLMGLKGLAAADIDAAIVATVVPQALFNFRSLCREYFGAEVLVVGEENVELGIEVRIEQLLGVYSGGGSPVVFIAFAGTAIGGEPRANDEVMELGLFEPAALPELAFPHDPAIIDAWRRSRGMSAESPGSSEVP